MTAVVDASVVLAALITNDPIGAWAEQQLTSHGRLVAPEHLHVEAANVLRRAQLAGQLDPSTASMAFADLRRLPVRTIAFDPLAERIWSLRSTLTASDAAYVAAAEALDAPLLTLDLKMVNASGTTCTFVHP